MTQRFSISIVSIERTAANYDRRCRYGERIQDEPGRRGILNVDLDLHGSAADIERIVSVRTPSVVVLLREGGDASLETQGRLEHQWRRPELLRPPCLLEWELAF